ncbi:uncharacterized protein A1O5_03984 [Cladophialophora psammophila CBS 110553]|uniref:Fe2OG dioxygenase domain-containing protein n=1 Tax=Cladophialophora psammophila CBS 110553 TaxID=1182543 RepID=W9X7G4_9EURO|nr:uncharacterized protein A1O5_03984 [Cladophialophora psammophila CBS 110553]EXJ72836.1 hypothetical protein A1O5_03984 [Cladophialophora psammophila CBS 110553]
MSTTPQAKQAGFVKLELRTAYGPVYRNVSTNPPRDARSDEIPLIDLSPIYDDDLEARQALARTIRHAAENTGFFYIRNHGIPEAVIQAALDASRAFFAQPEDKKMLVSKAKGKWYNGYSAKNTAMASPSEGLDYRESFSWRYEPQYDPDPKDPDAVPAEVRPYIRGENYVWEGTEHLAGFKKGCIAYWQECLKLARRLVGVFALCLDLPETYFDAVTTYPGSDGVFNYYPAMSPEDAAKSQDIGLGSHTDLQCFTLLWQDMNGGLQVLNKEGQWIKATPLEGTFVVNIGDYLMRLTNDRMRSTVHRVYNRSTVDRYSMPFFFGFNFNEKCGVLPSCVDDDNPPKYEPISCGDWCQLRFQQTDMDNTKAAAVY